MKKNFIFIWKKKNIAIEREIMFRNQNDGESSLVNYTYIK